MRRHLKFIFTDLWYQFVGFAIGNLLSFHGTNNVFAQGVIFLLGFLLILSVLLIAMGISHKVRGSCRACRGF